MNHGRWTNRGIGGASNTKTTTVVRVEVGTKGTTNNCGSLPRGTASRCSTATVIDVRDMRISKRRSESRNSCNVNIKIHC